MFVFFARKGKKETLSVSLAQDQSSHVMWDLLFVGLEIRGGEQQSWAGDNWARKSQEQPGAFPPEMSQERLCCPGGCGECQELRGGRMSCSKPE